MGHNKKYRVHTEQVPYGVAVRIPGFHSSGPSSTFGMRTVSCLSVYIHYVAIHSCASITQFKLDINWVHT